MSVQLRPTFEIFVDDRRYAVPTLHLVSAEDEAAARQIAEQMVSESDHHVGAELCYEGRLLVSLGEFGASRGWRRGGSEA